VKKRSHEDNLVKKGVKIMHQIVVRSHVGSDGILQMKIPTEFKDADLQVTVTIETVTPTVNKTPEELGYPSDFFERTAGAFQDEPLIREDQGEYEITEELA